MHCLIMIAGGIFATYVAAKEAWSHAELHYGEKSQIEGVSCPPKLLTNSVL